MVKVSESLVTTYPVITETCYTLIQLVSQTAQRKFLRALCQNTFQLFQLERHHLKRMTQLMEQYADLPMDLADASLVVLAEKLGHGRILIVNRRDFTTSPPTGGAASTPFKILCLIRSPSRRKLNARF